MPKYEVRIPVTGEAIFVVEAKDTEEAEEKAREKADYGFEPEWVELDDDCNDITEVA